MKALLMIAAVMIRPSPAPGEIPRTECQLDGVYSAVPADPGTLLLTGYGDVQEIATLLVPVYLEPGRYRVSLSREGSDLYKSLEGIYFRTRYCYEYVYYQDTVVEIMSSGAIARGAIIFDG